MVIAKGSVSMKKAGLITIALVLVAAVGIIVYYRSQDNGRDRMPDKGQGTMVQRDAVPAKECIRKWKICCM